jgi:tight adherence protein B
MIASAALNGAQPAILLFGGVSVVTLLGAWLLGSGSGRRSALISRGTGDHSSRLSLITRLDARVVRTRRGALLAGRLRSAGTKLSAVQFIGLTAGAAAAAFAVASVLFPTVLALVAGLLGAFGVRVWLDKRLGRRKEEFVAQLPEVARLLSNGSSAGLSMVAAIEVTVREIEAPAKDELQAVLDEIRLGRTLADSLAALQVRLPSREIAVLMTTLVIQQRAGGDVVRALQDLSDTLDGRRETLREVKTLMSGALVTSYIVPVLGLGALLMLNTVNSHTLDRMTTQPIGIVVLVIAGMLYALGSTGIRRISRVDL